MPSSPPPSRPRLAEGSFASDRRRPMPCVRCPSREQIRFSTDDGVIPPLLRLGVKRRADSHLLLREEKVIELGAIR